MADADVVPGTLLQVHDRGVLITGESGSGKSDLALMLLDRGHSLVADDAVELVCIDGALLGRCPARLQGLLEVRGLGLMPVTSSEPATVPVDLVIHLETPDHDGWAAWPRLEGKWDSVSPAGIRRPRLRIPVAPGRPLALLIEMAVSRVNGGDNHG